MSDRNPWPAGLVATIGLFALALFGFVAFTTTQRVDLVAEDYYALELAHQDEIDRLRRGVEPSRRPAWVLEGRTLSLAFPPGGRPEEGEVTLSRPSDARLDRSFPLAVDPRGVATVDLADLPPGSWRLRLAWTADGEEHAVEDRLALP